MGRSRYKIFENEYPYFITSTTIEWLPLFGIKELAQIIIDSLNFLIKEQRIDVFGWVMMENHIHLIALSTNLSKEMNNFKSFTARKIIDYLIEHDYQKILNNLKLFKLKYRIDMTYQLWQEGIHPVQIFNSDILRQKLEYIHLNPVRKGYVEEPKEWRYSSAVDYAGKKGLVSINMDWF
jgi:REP element-mobilizing transposase RayT